MYISDKIFQVIKLLADAIEAPKIPKLGIKTKFNIKFIINSA